MFGFGSLIGWYFGSKSTLNKFPEIFPSDRILIISPHIDDEVISSAGLIQKALSKGAQVKIVYLTNGDNNYLSVIFKNRNFKQTPNDFIALGEKRMSEAKESMAVLKVSSDNLIFLGYPDGGLKNLLKENFLIPYTHKALQFNYNPYKGTYKQGQLYKGINLYNDLKEIIESFKPTIIIFPHPRDLNLDHQASYYFTLSALEENTRGMTLFAYLVHYKNYPFEKGLHLDKYLYPPNKLFSKEGWYSLDLTPEEIQKKLEALLKEKTQLYYYPSGGKNLLESFVCQNEIFEEIINRF
ncbi:MAG: PIG-L deacetylase family protein [Minisyncoccia bacterium]